MFGMPLPIKIDQLGNTTISREACVKTVQLQTIDRCANTTINPSKNKKTMTADNILAIFIF